MAKHVTLAAQRVFDEHDISPHLDEEFANQGPLYPVRALSASMVRKMLDSAIPISRVVACSLIDGPKGKRPPLWGGL